MKGEGASRAPGSGSDETSQALLPLDPMCWAEPRARQKFDVCGRRLRPNEMQHLADV